MLPTKAEGRDKFCVLILTKLIPGKQHLEGKDWESGLKLDFNPGSDFHHMTMWNNLFILSLLYFFILAMGIIISSDLLHRVTLCHVLLKIYCAYFILCDPSKCLAESVPAIVEERTLPPYTSPLRPSLRNSAGLEDLQSKTETKKKKK